MLILSFESSCDETSAAVCEFGSPAAADGTSTTAFVPRIRSNIIASQIETHRLYGGVVPEKMCIRDRSGDDVIRFVSGENAV